MTGPSPTIDQVVIIFYDMPLFPIHMLPVSSSIDLLILSHDVVPFIVLLVYLSHKMSLFYCPR